jgi:2-methylaconitate cis-trans-isomerase PrpF
MKKTGTVLIAIIVLSLFLGTVALAEPNMQEGTWEIKGEMKMEGLPFPMPPIPMTFTQCLTKKDMVPQKKEKNQDCKTIKNEIVGNTVSWVMQCKDKNGVADSTGEITYKGNSFTGTVHTVTTMETKGEKTESTMQMSGKRTGDCK